MSVQLLPEKEGTRAERIAVYRSAPARGDDVVDARAEKGSYNPGRSPRGFSGRCRETTVGYSQAVPQSRPFLARVSNTTPLNVLSALKKCTYGIGGIAG